MAGSLRFQRQTPVALTQRVLEGVYQSGGPCTTRGAASGLRHTLGFSLPELPRLYKRGKFGLAEFRSANQENDHRARTPSTKVGEIMAAPLNPVLFEWSAAAHHLPASAEGFFRIGW